MQILIKNQSVEAFLKEIADEWRDLKPRDYEHFRKHIAEESMSLVKRSGMSRDGHFMNFMYIPQDLYTFIKWQAHKRLGIQDFFKDTENYRLLKKVWPDASVKTKPTQILDLGASYAKATATETSHLDSKSAGD